MRLAVLGGSSLGTVTLLRLLEEQPGPTMEVALWGRSQMRLDATLRAAGALGRVAAKATPDLAAALAGADAVLIQVRPGGLEAREFDEQAPTRLGLIGEETLGAGGVLAGLRAVPVLWTLGRAVRDVAPDAWVLNLTNPAGICVRTLLAAGLRRDRVVGLCDVPGDTVRQALSMAGFPSAEAVQWLGVNHWGFLTGLRAGGEDLMPSIIARLGESDAGPDGLGLVAQDLGAVPCSYMKFFYSRGVYAPSAPATYSRATALRSLESDAEAARRAGDGPALAALAERRAAHWYEEVVWPVIAALHSETVTECVLQVSLRPEAWVREVVCSVSMEGVDPHPLPTGVPADIGALVDLGAEVEKLVVEAALEGNEHALRRALYASPLVDDQVAASRVVELARESCVWPPPVLA